LLISGARRAEEVALISRQFEQLRALPIVMEMEEGNMRTETSHTVTARKGRPASRSRRGAPGEDAVGEHRRAAGSSRIRSKPRAKQGELLFRSWGGARKGAGRKPKGERAMAPHATRPAHAESFPVLVTTRLHSGLPSLRHAPEAARILAALACANAHANDEQPLRAPRPPSKCAAPPFQVVHHSIQTNHLHLIVEASDRVTLTSGTRWLLARIARALNRRWGRRGSVFADRFHERELRSPRQVRNALVYVLQNSRKHGISLLGPDELGRGKHVGSDGAGSAAWSGFLAQLRAARAEPPSAKTWLLGLGWRRHGLIDPGETPRGG
jgi:hypothetical protein